MKRAVEDESGSSLHVDDPCSTGFANTDGWFSPQNMGDRKVRQAAYRLSSSLRFSWFKTLFQFLPSKTRRLSYRLLLPLLFGLIPISSALADSYPRSTAIDAIHYRLQLTLTAGRDDVQGETEILFQFNADGVGEIALDFSGLMTDQVTEDERAARFTHNGDKLQIALGGTYRRGERCRIAIKYHGRPDDGLIIRKNQYGDFAYFADNWPNRAHHWFPGIDHPYDKATAEFIVTAPADYDVIANGRLVEKRSLQNGNELTHWREETPIPTYCMVIGAAQFAILNLGEVERDGPDVPVFYYLYPKDRDRGAKSYGRVREIIEFFSSLVGPYPYEKLALVQSTTRYGGMENASSIFLAEAVFDEHVNAHEIAHQWFGDSVTEADWHHLWLSEGFATYFANLFAERFEGRDKFVQLMLKNKEAYLKEYASDPRPVYDPTITDLMKLLNRNSYEKGGWVLHMLRHLLGDEKFFAGIRDYYRTYRDRNALTEDLQRVMEFHYGQPLGWFFKQWIYEPGYPQLDARWRWNEGAKELTLRIEQRQSQSVFKLPLEVEFKLDNSARRETLNLNERAQSFTFKLAAKPQSVALDPDEWVLKVLTLRGEE
jgi:aminopeptidase N